MSTVVEIKRPMGAVGALAEQYQMDPLAFAQTLKATVFPSGQATQEQLAAFCVVAKEYGLNPFTKQCYAFPNKGGGITPMISVDGWASIMNANPMMDGIDFEPLRDGEGHVYAMRCSIKRKDRSHPISVVEFLDECKGTSGPWVKSPMRMLRHRAMIQCIRIAFSLSGVYDEQDAQEILDAEVSNATPEPKSLRQLTERFTPKPAAATPQEPEPEPSPVAMTPDESARLEREAYEEEQRREAKASTAEAAEFFGGDTGKKPRKQREH